MYYNARKIQEHLNRGDIKIIPYIEKFQGPNLYYCHMGNNLLVPRRNRTADTRNLADDLYDKVEVEDFYDLRPGEFILAETFEEFTTNNNHIIRLFNSSSLARLGVAHCALGMVNPGCGVKIPVRLTLELINTGPFVVRLYPTKIDKLTGKAYEIGTEILKVAVAPHEEVVVSYEDWSGSIYGSDKNVAGSKIDKRFR